MDEQRLQEIERDIKRIECPECEGGVFCSDVDGLPEICEECDGTGWISQFPAATALIAEVRRLQANDANAVRKLRNLTASFEACDDCGANACDDAKPDGPHILCHDCLGKHRTLASERDAALAERDALRDAICPGWQEKGLADKLVALARAFRSDSETMDEIGEDFDGSYRQAVIERDALRADLDRAKMEVVRFKAERDAALQWRSPSAAQALTEARRVLREVEWVSQHGKITGPSIPEWAWCPCCGKTRQDDHTPADCALAAVLAQEGK